MLQGAERQWPDAAVHDSIQAVLRDPAFRRSLRRSLADRLLLWLSHGFERLLALMKHLPSARSLALGFAVLIAAFVVLRLMLAARARDAGGERVVARGTSAQGDDPWVSADLLASAGRFEDAAHALYRGVILALGRMERLRLDPARTSGDYARELRRRRATSFGAFRAFTSRFDVVVYGHGQPDATAIAQLRELSAPFRAGTRVA